MIKAIIFDFGGVIVRTEDYGPRHTWDTRLGLAPGSVERVVHGSDLWVQAQLGRITPRRYWDGVAEMLYMKVDDIGDLRRDFFSGDRINYRLVELIRELREANYPVALLSNDSIELRSKLRTLELDGLFNHILISAEIGVMKPDVTAYRVALRALNVAPQEAVFIDDSLANIRGAQSLHMHAILYRPETDVKATLTTLLEDQAE